MITPTTGASPGPTREATKRPHRMSLPQSRVGLGRGREVSRTARHNILANASQIRRKKNRSKGHPSHENRKFSTGACKSSINESGGDPIWNSWRDRALGFLTSAQRSCYNRDGGGNSSTGRAPDCGSDGCGFDSRFPPQNFFQRFVPERLALLGWTLRLPPRLRSGLRQNVAGGRGGRPYILAFNADHIGKRLPPSTFFLCCTR